MDQEEAEGALAAETSAVEVLAVVLQEVAPQMAVLVEVPLEEEVLQEAGNRYSKD